MLLLTSRKQNSEREKEKENVEPKNRIIKKKNGYLEFASKNMKKQSSPPKQDQLKAILPIQWMIVAFLFVKVSAKCKVPFLSLFSVEFPQLAQGRTQTFGF